VTKPREGTFSSSRLGSPMLAPRRCMSQWVYEMMAIFTIWYAPSPRNSAMDQNTCVRSRTHLG
jgi:hypothetical protein